MPRIRQEATATVSVSKQEDRKRKYVCQGCKSSHKACDKVLPSCSTCAARKIPCIPQACEYQDHEPVEFSSAASKSRLQTVNISSIGRKTVKNTLTPTPTLDRDGRPIGPITSLGKTPQSLIRAGRRGTYRLSADHFEVKTGDNWELESDSDATVTDPEMDNGSDEDGAKANNEKLGFWIYKMSAALPVEEDDDDDVEDPRMVRRSYTAADMFNAVVLGPTAKIGKRKIAVPKSRGMKKAKITTLKEKGMKNEFERVIADSCEENGFASCEDELMRGLSDTDSQRSTPTMSAKQSANTRAQLVKDINNLDLGTKLMLCILSFFPSLDTYRLRRVCQAWHDHLAYAGELLYSMHKSAYVNTWKPSPHVQLKNNNYFKPTTLDYTPPEMKIHKVFGELFGGMHISISNTGKSSIRAILLSSHSAQHEEKFVELGSTHSYWNEPFCSPMKGSVGFLFLEEQRDEPEKAIKIRNNDNSSLKVGDVLSGLTRKLEEKRCGEGASWYLMWNMPNGKGRVTDVYRHVQCVFI